MDLLARAAADEPAPKGRAVVAGLFFAAVLVTGCASDQRKLVRSQTAHLYHATRQVAVCSVPKPAIDCNVTAALLDQWRRDEELAIKSAAMACNVATGVACVTHGMFQDALAALKRDRAAVRKAGVR